jgi:hypothetical protein
MIDIDVQFNETLAYETLKELLNIVRNCGNDWIFFYLFKWLFFKLLSVSCKEAHININNEPLSIDVTLHNSNILVRLTSNNNPAIQLSRIIKIYTKFDKRVLSLLRLFRIFSKVRFSVNKNNDLIFFVSFYIGMWYWSIRPRNSSSSSFPCHDHPFSSTTRSTRFAMSSRICMFICLY